MNIRYDILFQVNIVHGYYEQKGSNFIIQPTRRTFRLLDRYGLQFRRTGNGFIVLYETKNRGSLGEAVRPIEEEIVLSFAIIAPDPYLLNYSDLPLKKPNEQIYRLHNMRDNNQNNLLLLTADQANAALSPLDLVTLKPVKFTHAFSTTNPVEIEIIHELLGSVARAYLEPVDDVVNIPVDVQRFPPGLVRLNVDGTTIVTFYADSELDREPVFGVVDLVHRDSVPAASRYADAKGIVSKKTYTIQINNRKTTWRYNLALKYETNIDENDLIVEHPDHTVTFTRRTTQTADQGKILMFSSNRPLAIQEQPVQSITLKRKKNGNEKTLIKHLPNPTVSSLNSGSTQSDYISDMYIYL